MGELVTLRQPVEVQDIDEAYKGMIDRLDAAIADADTDPRLAEIRQIVEDELAEMREFLARSVEVVGRVNWFIAELKKRRDQCASPG